MLKTEVVAGGWWVGWGKNTHLTFLRDRTPTLYSAHLLHTYCTPTVYSATTHQLKVDAPQLYMNTIAMGSKPEYEGKTCIKM